MRIFILAIFSLAVLILQTSCGIKGKYRYNQLTSVANDSLVVWLGVYNPITYRLSLTRDNAEVTLYTHKTRNKKLIERSYKVPAGKVIPVVEAYDLINLPTCEEDQDFTCFGLDGYATWVQIYSEGSTVRKHYWTPQAQESSDLGRKVTGLQRDLEARLYLDSLKIQFLSILKRGRYDNGGGFVMKVK